MRTREVLSFALAAGLAFSDTARALTYVNLMDEPAPRQSSRRPEVLPEPGQPEPAARAPETLAEPGTEPPPPAPAPAPPRTPAQPPPPPASSLQRGVATIVDPEPPRAAPVARERPRAKPRRRAVPAPEPRVEQEPEESPAPLAPPRPAVRRTAPGVAAPKPAPKPAPVLRTAPVPPRAPAPPERKKAWASAGLYAMSYKSDISSPNAADPIPGGGGNIQNLEVGLGGPWSVGYSRIGILGDLPGSQSDAHVNFALPEGWVVQAGVSMGEVATRPGGPINNDFRGATYSILKSFRISPQWRFQASYTNVPIHDVADGVTRPIKARVGYHLFTVSYSPSKVVNKPKWAIDAGLLRLTDIRPIGFNYLYAGASYRFQVPALLNR